MSGEIFRFDTKSLWICRKIRDAVIDQHERRRSKFFREPLAGVPQRPPNRNFHCFTALLAITSS